MSVHERRMHFKGRSVAIVRAVKYKCHLSIFFLILFLAYEPMSEFMELNKGILRVSSAVRRPQMQT